MMTHKDLNVWKNSIDLVILIYKLTENFPNEELYGLTSQMRRSAVSVPSNIAEGAGRFHKKEFNQFLYISLASLAELETIIIISFKLDYIQQSDFEVFEEKIKIIRTQISGLIKHNKTKI